MRKKKNRYDVVIEEYDKRINALTLLRDVLTEDEVWDIRQRIYKYIEEQIKARRLVK